MTGRDIQIFRAAKFVNVGPLSACLVTLLRPSDLL